MINWVKSSKVRRNADCSVSLVNSKNRICIRFSSGAYAVKLKNAERIRVGIDDSGSRLYFEADEEGYKVNHNGSTATILIMSNKIQEYIHPSAICGVYDLNKDRDGHVYVSIGALPR